MPKPLSFYCDDKRHVVCLPYSVDNLHLMAHSLSLAPCWYHSGKGKRHYDIPKQRIAEITARCKVVSSRDILHIIQHGCLPVPC